MVKVLYIAGFGRSGSTVISNVLGSAQGFFQVGEVSQLFELGWNGVCGCGAPVPECEVWAPVVEQALGSAEPGLIAQTNGLRNQTARWRYFLSLVRGRSPSRIAGPLSSYIERLDALYSAIEDVAEARVVVDSSKMPPYAAVLDRAPSVELCVVHLVRDARAAAFSWARRKVRDDPDRKEMIRYTPLRSAGLWDLTNLGTEIAWGRSPRYLRLCYESFVADPQRETQRMLTFIGEPEAETALERNGKVRLGENHMIHSNPNRSTRGEIQIRADDEWRTAMSAGAKATVTTFTWPLQLRYGYGLGTRHRLDVSVG